MFRAARRFSPIVAVDRDGVRLMLETADEVVAPWTFALGPFASTVLQRALAVLDERGHRGLRGRTVLEVGANIGTETVSFVRLYGAHSVIAVEPAPGNVELLDINVAVNHLDDRVCVLPVALSDVEGSVPFALGPDPLGWTRWGWSTRPSP